MNKKSSRESAYEVLYEIILNDAYSNISLNKFFSKYSLENKDKRYITEVVYGTIKNKIYLEYILNKYSKTRIKSKIKVLLLMAIYQLIFMDKTPNFAIVNEIVNISKKIGGTYTSKFVNGILRNIAQNFSEDNLQFENEEEKFCIENSCPKELYDILTKQYGLEKGQSIIKSFIYKSKNSIRINKKKTNIEEVIKYFSSKKIEVKRSKISTDCLVVDKSTMNDEKFLAGEYIIQDEASALVAHTINEDKSKNYNILDVCAAPGGKSLHVATEYFNSNLISCDKYIHKLKLIEDNVKKLGINNIKILEQDATIYNSQFKEKFDIIICDVPCSGIGVIKNKPEIKYKINDNYINDISQLQLKILENSIKYLKKNGIIIYSTCTIDKRENEYNIDKFLEKNKNFKLDKITTDGIVKEYKAGMISILPDEYNCDGFFICKMRKLED
ncbi:16S rRNA (cytosine(967)-C(5))-methyltransferase RsmB [Gemella sp. zg-570]|uniref:16S rRNA (cytosine(967)-C(5))-methyltransferase RsmB n=1 Tax=Gemella sp. zg-570 TaxID=2840371 RepID=UPI001C0D1559|nr:16S rRNA (cytosine(967)-C(5))-methyltransferase RsmB [Gemella sp. zg-570]QWQ39452.1 16S rRNA (cytosine(967)-C(5))-methyltransferase RsmB [Gemella sp. zg-570]